MSSKYPVMTSLRRIGSCNSHCNKLGLPAVIGPIIDTDIFYEFISGYILGITIWIHLCLYASWNRPNRLTCCTIPPNSKPLGIRISMWYQNTKDKESYSQKIWIGWKHTKQRVSWLGLCLNQSTISSRTWHVRCLYPRCILRMIMRKTLWHKLDRVYLYSPYTEL
jgi:hypothetical protein